MLLSNKLSVFKLTAVACACMLSYQVQAASDCNNIEQWSASKAYSGGDTAKQQNAVYKANWWTQGQDPSQFSGDYQEWTKVDECGSSDADKPEPDKPEPEKPKPEKPKPEPDTDTDTDTDTDSGVAPGGNYPAYSEGTAYKGGDIVVANNVLYQCMEGATAPWCSGAAWAYAPGEGTAWQSAWKVVSGNVNPQPDSDPELEIPEPEPEIPDIDIDQELEKPDSEPEPEKPEPETTEPEKPKPETEPELDTKPPKPNLPITSPGGLCQGFNVYPDWTRGDHSTGGDVMVYNNIAYSAIYWTQTLPGSDASWSLQVNCDGSEPGSAPLLSLQNPTDPIPLELPDWPNTFVIASPTSEAPPTLEIQASTSKDLGNLNTLISGFESVIRDAKEASFSTVIIISDVLDKATLDQNQFGTIAVKDALMKAVENTHAEIDTNKINALSNDLKGWAQAHNLILTTIAPTANHGWSLSIGDFAYDTHSGRQSVWDKASQYTAGLLDQLELYNPEEDSRSDFVAFRKSNSTEALSDDQWHNALEYVKQVTDFIKAPAMLATVPTNQATNYFMGNTTADQKIRKAAYSNVFAILFDQDSANLESKIEHYQTAKVPLYSVKNAGKEGALTIIPALNSELANAGNVMDNEVFLFETPESQWIPSTVYKWSDFLEGLNAMHNTGVAGNKYWLLDKSADDATNIMYAKVAIAAFLAQSMQETIRYNACDENNWSETRFGAPTDYPMAASCGQLGQKYADYGFNPATGLDHPYSCPRNEKMEVSAITHAKWYGAPAPVFAVPDAVLEERGQLVNGSSGRWTNQGHCNDVPDKVDTSKQIWERDECKIYVGQKAGKFIWDGSSQESVQGCGWWGRGVIQTTGRQNFGTLNHYLGRSHVNPDLIGKTVEGVKIESPPANPLYPELDFCSDPGLICSSEENREIKWIAGLFYWVTSVQAYSNEGGPYADWNYYVELKKYVNGGLKGSEFINDVSGIVNRGCPDVACDTGEVHNIKERQANFKLVLEKLGLKPQ